MRNEIFPSRLLPPGRPLFLRPSPNKRQLPNFRDIFYDIIRLFFRPCGNLRLELAVPQANRVHPQFFACADFPHRPVADDKNLARLQSCPLLDFAEGCFFSYHVVAVGVIDLFDGRFAVEPQRSHFCVLGFRFAKADDEIFNASFRQKAQQR
jgi:hypothetical protein